MITTFIQLYLHVPVNMTEFEIHKQIALLFTHATLIIAAHATISFKW